MRGFGRVLFRAVSFVCIGYWVLMGLVAIGVFSGIEASTVHGESMLPTIMPDDLALVRRGGFEGVELGDVIVFCCNPEGSYIVHRVVGSTGKGENHGFRTKGDGNPDIDPVSYAVYPHNFVGKTVAVIPKAGIFNYYSRQPYIVFGFAMLACLLLDRLRKYKSADREADCTNE